MTEDTVTPTPVAPPTTTPGTVMGFITGQSDPLWSAGHFIMISVYSGSSGTKSSGGTPYTTHYNYNQGTSSTNYKGGKN